MTTGRLTGRSMVITGASGEIGAATARLCARHGARIGVHYHRSRDAATRLVEEIRAANGSAEALRADLSREDEVNALVTKAGARLGHLDAWFNNAGADILTGENARTGDNARLRRLLEVDLLGTILCCWKVAPLMQKAGGGVIINMSWDLSGQGMAGRNPEIFAAVKGGVTAFTKCLAKSQAPLVRVNDVAPGWIETAFAREVMSREYYEDVVQKTPLQRFGAPEDVAQAVLFLVSREADFITGQTIRVNGGLVS